MDGERSERLSGDQEQRLVGFPAGQAFGSIGRRQFDIHSSGEGGKSRGLIEKFILGVDVEVFETLVWRYSRPILVYALDREAQFQPIEHAVCHGSDRSPLILPATVRQPMMKA